MATGPDKQRFRSIALGASLILVTAVWGVRAKYTPGLYCVLAGIQFTVVCLAAWRLGASAIGGKEEERRRLAAAGALLVTPFALVAFLPGMGPPGAGQTAAEEQHRYLVLLVNSIAISGGWVFLRQALSEAGERFYSTLGFAAIMVAAPLYVVFMIIMLGAHRTAELARPGEWPTGFTSLIELADLFLFFGGALTYLATAAFAASLTRIEWLGRKTARAVVTMSLLALVCLALRGLTFPDPDVAFLHWHTTIGWIVGIPAVPWIVPCVIGVVLLRRVGSGAPLSRT